jgi:hypothetical protein
MIIGKDAFSSRSLQEVNFSKYGVTYIGESAFDLHNQIQEKTPKYILAALFGGVPNPHTE